MSEEKIEYERMLDIVGSALLVGFTAGRSNQGILLDVDPKRSTIAFEFSELRTS